MALSIERLKYIRRNYGWRPDIPDSRDFLYAVTMGVTAVLPAKIDLRSNCSPVEDQGQLGSCTANALVGSLEFLELRAKVEPADLSRLFVYYNERVIEGTVRTDSGAMLRDGIKSLVTRGVCCEECWPYSITMFARKPGASCYKEAVDRKITSYHRLDTVDEMRSCLAERYPFVFGFSVYESFESSVVAKSGVVELPEPGERLLGGHAVMAVGYDDLAKRFIVRNSWGEEWGKKGYFTIPYEYLENRNLSDDFWTIRK